MGLEGAIREEKLHEPDADDLLSQELRLQQRLARLNLEIDVMDGDGNCLVSCFAHQALSQHMEFQPHITCTV